MPYYISSLTTHVAQKKYIESTNKKVSNADPIEPKYITQIAVSKNISNNNGSSPDNVANDIVKKWRVDLMVISPSSMTLIP